MRRIKLWAAAAVFGLSFLGQAFGQTKGDRVVVVVKQTDLKNEAAVVKTIYHGTSVDVRDVKGNWLWVDCDGTRGWLQRDHVILASRAIEHFTEELRRNPKDVDALHARADALNDKGEHSKAIRDCTDAIAIDPNRAWGYASRGYVWKRKGEYELGISDFAEAIRLAPTHGGYYFGRGLCHSLNGNKDAAIADLTEAIRLDPKDSRSYSFRASYYDSQKQSDKALADLTMAISLDPQYLEALGRRAWIWEEKQDWKSAAADYTAILTIKPEDGGIHSGLGRMYEKMGDLDRALACFDHALACYQKEHKNDSRNVPLLQSRARLWSVKRDWKRAAADYLQCLVIKPEDGHTYLLLGKIYAEMDDLRQVIACYEKASQFKCEPYLFVDLSRAYRSRGQYAEANAICETYLANDDPCSLNGLFPKCAVAEFLASCPDPKFRDGERAVKLATEAMTIGEYPWTCQKALAAAYAETGQFEKAIELQKQVVADALEKARNECEARLKLYESGQPYRDVPKAGVATTTTAAK